MATNLTEKRRAGFFIASEATGHRSREQEILITGENLEAGSIVGKITASSKLIEYDPGAGDGSEDVYGVLIPTINATAEDKDVVALVRDCEVDEDDLTWFSGASAPQIATGIAELKALGIIARPSGVTQTLADQQ